MGRRGPKPPPQQELFFFASQLYWDFRRLAEGFTRSQFDSEHYQRMKAVAEKGGFPLNDSEIAEFERKQKAIRAARLTGAEKELRLERAEWVMLEPRFEHAADEAMKEVKVPGKPDVLQALLRAETPEAVRKICRDAFVRERSPVFDPETGEPAYFMETMLSNWPISSGSRSPHYLALHAEQFITAKDEPRFPRSNRPTSLNKQIWFRSLAVAAAEYGRKTRTAINSLGSKTPEEVFEESHSAKPVRRRAKPRVSRGSK